jgi:hypothetical protein
VAARRPGRRPAAGAVSPPPLGTTPSALIAQIASIDKEISVHQDILRGAALTVYQPLLDEALSRIRMKAAELAVPQAALPETVKGLPLGAPVTVTMSPAEAAVVIGHRIHPETGQPELLLLVKGKGIVVARPDEVTPGLPSSTSTSTSEVSVPGPLPQQPESPAVSSMSGSIHAGDLVDTPAGPGRVVAEPMVEGAPYKVDVRGQDVYMFSRAELKVVPPPTASSPSP